MWALQDATSRSARTVGKSHQQIDSSTGPEEAEPSSGVASHLMRSSMLAAASRYDIRSDYSSEVYGVYSELRDPYHPELTDHS